MRWISSSPWAGLADSVLLDSGPHVEWSADGALKSLPFEILLHLINTSHPLLRFPPSSINSSALHGSVCRWPDERQQELKHTCWCCHRSSGCLTEQPRVPGSTTGPYSVGYRCGLYRLDRATGASLGVTSVFVDGMRVAAVWLPKGG